MSKGGTPKVKQSPSDVQQAQILGNIENQFSSPLRNVITPQVLSTLQNNNAFSTELPGSARDAYEGQFAQAKNDIMNSAGGRGGSLRAALINNANQRASSIAKATDDYRQLGVERAMGLIPTALPNASTQMSARSQIASNDQQRNQYNAQAQQQGQNSLMSGLGGLASLAMMFL